MPKGLRKFHFLFEKSGLTRFGGLSLFQSFCKSLGLRHFLQLYIRWPDYHHREYHPADLFLAHMLAIVAGIGRIENTQSLISNGLIPPLLGLANFPHRDTLRTFLWRFTQKDLRSLKAAHDKLTVKVAPADGYGDYSQDLIQKVPRRSLKGIPKITVGMRLHAQTGQGPRAVTVKAVTGDMVTLDANHPLAGKNLNFDIEILDVRDASAEELAHGHVHGPGGHH